MTDFHQAVQDLLDWVPTCSVGSSGYLRIERVKKLLAEEIKQQSKPAVRCTSDPNTCCVSFCSWPSCTEPGLR